MIIIIITIIVKIMKIFIVFNDFNMIISIIFTVFIIIIVIRRPAGNLWMFLKLVLKFEFVIVFGSEFQKWKFWRYWEASCFVWQFFVSEFSKFVFKFEFVCLKLARKGRYEVGRYWQAICWWVAWAGLDQGALSDTQTLNYPHAHFICPLYTQMPTVCRCSFLVPKEGHFGPKYVPVYMLFYHQWTPPTYSFIVFN